MNGIGWATLVVGLVLVRRQKSGAEGGIGRLGSSRSHQTSLLHANQNILERRLSVDLVMGNVLLGSVL